MQVDMDVLLTVGGQAIVVGGAMLKIGQWVGGINGQLVRAADSLASLRHDFESLLKKAEEGRFAKCAIHSEQIDAIQKDIRDLKVLKKKECNGSTEWDSQP